MGPKSRGFSNLFKDDGDMLREIVTAHDCFLTLSVHLRVEFTDKALREVPAFFLDAACAGVLRSASALEMAMASWKQALQRPGKQLAWLTRNRKCWSKTMMR